MKLIQEGPRNAKIVIVGEAPGDKEIATDRPFVGGAGTILDGMLSACGISRSQCFITNVCHVKAPSNDPGYFYKKDNQIHLLQGMLQLKKDLEEIKPNLVIALGAMPLKVLTGKDGITAWRGSILESVLVPGLKVIGTYHPAAILRQWDYKCVAEFDLRRCRAQAKFPEIIRPKRDFYLDPPADVRTTLVQEMLQAEWLSIDIECWQDADTGKWKLACVGFSDRADRALVIVPRGAAERADIKALCESPVKKVFQNGIFDCTVLRDEGIIVENFAWDTMIGHQIIFAESAGGDDEMAKLTGKKRSAALAKGLAFQTSIYTEEPYYKADGKLWKESGDIMIFYRYNALDASVTMEIRDVQEKLITEMKAQFTFEHSMQLVQPIMEATRHGIMVDVAVRKAMRDKVESEAMHLQDFIDAGAGTKINVKSNKQMVALLYDQLKLPKKKNAAGNLTADKDTIVELGMKTTNPLLHAIIQLRQRRDLIERYLDVPLGADLRMRCQFDVTGTRSGRLSSRASLDGTGTNLQNIPEELRKMFIAPPGHSFVYRDYSQAEARVVAYQSRCEGLIELFEDPSRDIHTENAARIFGKSPAVLEKNGGPVTDTERYLAKRVVHACNYGMAAARLVEIVNEDFVVTGVRITLQEARSLIERYFMLYPEIRQNFWREVEQEVRRSRSLTNAFGWTRQFFGRMDDKLLREAYSFVPQSTVGHLARIAWVRISQALAQRPELGALVLLNVHDSLLVQCPDAAVPEVVRIMEQEMDIPISIFGRTFRIPTDCKVGRNWGNYDKRNPDSNPDGLKEY